MNRDEAIALFVLGGLALAILSCVIKSRLKRRRMIQRLIESKAVFDIRSKREGIQIAMATLAVIDPRESGEGQRAAVLKCFDVLRECAEWFLARMQDEMQIAVMTEYRRVLLELQNFYVAREHFGIDGRSVRREYVERLIQISDQFLSARSSLRKFHDVPK